MRKAIFLAVTVMTLAACYSVPPALTESPASAGDSLLEWAARWWTTSTNLYAR